MRPFGIFSGLHKSVLCCDLLISACFANHDTELNGTRKEIKFSHFLFEYYDTISVIRKLELFTGADLLIKPLKIKGSN